MNSGGKSVINNFFTEDISLSYNCILFLILKEASTKVTNEITLESATTFNSS